MSSPILLALLVIALAAMAAFAYRASEGLRVRRRAAWELDRAEWRRWISRP